MSADSESADSPEPAAPPPATPQSTWHLPPGLGAVLLLVAWALAVTTLIERRPFGLDEATARAILFLWSISDEVASPVLTLGVPDFRSLYLIPAGVPFSGSLLAIKLCAMAVLVGAVLALVQWRRRFGDRESPLLASALLLLSPLAIAAVDRVAVGPFLLLTLALGAWADANYRASRVRFGGLYFAQLLLCLSAVTLHPAGLALPLALGLAWWRERGAPVALASPVPGRERTHVLAGLLVASLLGAALAAGWRQQAWFANPVTAPAGAIFAPRVAGATGTALTWLVGCALLLGAALTLWATRKSWRDDRLLSALALATLFAMPAGDATYCLLLLTLLLYWGFPLLLRLRLGAGRGTGFMAQRGVGFAALFALLTAFLAADRERYDEVREGVSLSTQDLLIQTLASVVQRSHPVAEFPGAAPGHDAARAPRVASQWPGRTMIACRCGVLPLPPGMDDAPAFLANLRGIDYVVFDPKVPQNLSLSQSFARLGGEHVETVALQPAGVILRVHAVPALPGTPPMPGAIGEQARG